MEKHATCILIPERSGIFPHRTISRHGYVHALIVKSSPTFCTMARKRASSAAPRSLEAMWRKYSTPHAYAVPGSGIFQTQKLLFVMLERMFSHLFTTCTFNVSTGERDIALQYGIDDPNKFKVIWRSPFPIIVARGGVAVADCPVCRRTRLSSVRPYAWHRRIQ